MVNLFNKTRSILAIDLSDDLTKVVLIASDGERFSLEGWDYYSEQNNGNTDFLQNYKPEAITVALSDAHTLCFAVPDLNSFNLEMEKRKRGLSIETQNSDFLKISNSSILAAVHKDMAEEVLKSVSDTFPSIPQVSISHSMVALFYIYLRSYRPQPEVRTAIIHKAGNIISILVAQTEIPVWEGSVELKTEDKEEAYLEITALLQSANEKLSASQYNLILLAGTCDINDVKKMRNFADQVELISPYRNNAFEIGRSVSGRRKEAQSEGHQLAVAIGCAGMLLEGIGLNLANTDIEIFHELPMERILEVEQTIFDLIATKTKATIKKTIPILLEQAQLLVIGLLIAIGLFGYRFYNNYQEELQLSQEIAKEESRATELSDIRTRYDDYNKKIKTIKERSSAINEIAKDQLAVRTVLKEIDSRIPKGIVFSELTIEDRNVKIRGYAPDRLAVFDFAKKIGTSIDLFTDVVPTYDDKTNVGNYEITFKYIGEIPINTFSTVNNFANNNK